MKFNTIIKAITFSFIAISGSVIADTITGKVTWLEVPTNTDVNTVYFRLDPMPANVTSSFYLRNGTGTSAGCTEMGSEKSTDRAYSYVTHGKGITKNRHDYLLCRH